MKLGLGLYDGMVTADNLRFAKQMSATAHCRPSAAKQLAFDQRWLLVL